MDALIKNNIPLIFQIRDIVNGNLKQVTSHVVYNERVCDEDTVSIVMTTHNRVLQTLFTLNTINNSSYKNVQVIIVDDSTAGYFYDDLFMQYDFQIDYIMIKNKKWINPCVNYNIGFKFVKGSRVIIQNSEVCHLGDIIGYVKENLTNGKYMVFDVINTGSFEHNNVLYHLYDNLHKSHVMQAFIQIIRNKNPKFHWYQHIKHRPADLHFLTAIHIDNLRDLDMCFDYDFCLGRWYDDNEFIYRIKNVLKLTIDNIEYEKIGLLGIHQHHDQVTLGTNNAQYKESIKLNYDIYTRKIYVFEKSGQWISMYKGNKDEIVKIVA